MDFLVEIEFHFYIKYMVNKKNEKISAHIYFSTYEISFFRLFRGTNTNKKKILPGFVKHTLVK